MVALSDAAPWSSLDLREHWTPFTLSKLNTKSSLIGSCPRTFIPCFMMIVYRVCTAYEQENTVISMFVACGYSQNSHDLLLKAFSKHFIRGDHNLKFWDNNGCHSSIAMKQKKEHRSYGVRGANSMSNSEPWNQPKNQRAIVSFVLSEKKFFWRYYEQGPSDIHRLIEKLLNNGQIWFSRFDKQIILESSPALYTIAVSVVAGAITNNVKATHSQTLSADGAQMTTTTSTIVTDAQKRSHRSCCLCLEVFKYGLEFCDPCRCQAACIEEASFCLEFQTEGNTTEETSEASTVWTCLTAREKDHQKQNKLPQFDVLLLLLHTAVSQHLYSQSPEG